MSYYVPPGSPPPPPPASRSNSYLLPSGSLQQTPPPSQQPPPPRARDQANPHHATLLTAWRAHHAGAWVRADALHADVRQLIDPKDRTAAIRQLLRQLVAACPELQAKSTGNRARPVALYRLIESEPVGLEG